MIDYKIYHTRIKVDKVGLNLLNWGNPGSSSVVVESANVTFQTSGGLFGNTQQQQPQQQQPGGTLTDLNSLATVAQALSLPIICGDERDML